MHKPTSTSVGPLVEAIEALYMSLDTAAMGGLPPEEEEIARSVLGELREMRGRVIEWCAYPNEKDNLLGYWIVAAR